MVDQCGKLVNHVGIVGGRHQFERINVGERNFLHVHAHNIMAGGGKLADESTAGGTADTGDENVHMVISILRWSL